MRLASEVNRTVAVETGTVSPLVVMILFVLPGPFLVSGLTKEALAN